MTSQIWQTPHISYSAETDGVLSEVVHMTQGSESMVDRRNVQRFKVSAPLTVTVGDSKIPAYTRDLSDRGVYFFVGSDDSKLIDHDIEFMLELPPEITLLPCCRVRCRGRVLRREASLMSFTGVAAQILDYVILGDAISAT
jgi:hypothetical protein